MQPTSQPHEAERVGDAKPDSRQAVSPTKKALPTPPPSEEALNRAWVARAKAVVSQTPADPFMRAERIGELRAQYQQEVLGLERTQ